MSAAARPPEGGAIPPVGRMSRERQEGPGPSAAARPPEGGAIPGAGAEGPPAQDAAFRNAVQAAASWFVRLADAPQDAALRDAWTRWHQQDALHAAAWERVAKVSRQAAALPAFAGSVLRRPQRVGRRALLRLVAVGALVGGTARLVQGDSRRWSTGTGERREYALADGTRVHLNAGSTVETGADAHGPWLWLRCGDMMVTTAAPLQVRTEQCELRVDAARFVVRLHEGGTQVAVRDGELFARAVTQAAFVRVHAHTQVWVTDAGVSPAGPIQGAADWVHGILAADAMRLDAFLAELSRHRPGWVQCASEVAALRLSGGFQLADTDAVLAMLPAVLPVEVHHFTRYWVRISPRGQRA
ncbi:DUF4880 domain-containing protein [Verticiella sediminum]|uniref:DUF4880 domain-containing protein n=1 Tax=Verticiella sediminum TaxID=1247510 RepID=A0A556B099_9BURK|nr:FecR domain-containing protein [Verticiella sediminum]TSH98617.1 DUF4880 domain-containing protein [Verticiella sediminum]